MAPEATWSSEQVRFSEDARRAARGALYYARMLEPGRDSWAPRLLTEARSQLETVQKPAKEKCCPKDYGTGPDTLCEFIGAKRRTCKELLSDWENLIAVKRDPKTTDAEALRKLEKGLAQFVRNSVPDRFSLRLTYVRIPALLHIVSEHAGFLIASIIAVVLGTMIEAVWALYKNNPWWSVGLILLVLAVPVGMAWMAKWNRRKGWTPLFDLGGRVHRKVWPHAVQPAPWRRRHPTDDDTRLVLRGRLLQLVLLMLLWTLAGIVILAVVKLDKVSDVRLTVYMITVILGTLVAIGAALDFADVHAQPPIRRSLLIVFAAYLIITLLAPWESAGLIVLALLFGALLVWLWRVRYFTQIIETFASVVVVLALVMGLTAWRRSSDAWEAVGEGKPSHWPADSSIAADLWPAGQGLEDPPPVVVMAASGGGSRAAIYTAMTLEALQKDLPHVLENLQAIGSVSGGSLASAAYVADRIAPASDSGRSCDGSLLDRVSADFLRPVILGVFSELKGRGQAIQSYWETKCPGLGHTRMSDLATLWRRQHEAGDSMPPFPVPLMHSSSLQRHAVVISPLAKKAFGVSDFDDEARSDTSNRYAQLDSAGRATWVYYRSGIYGLGDLVPGLDATLSSAVRASANFPFGFALVDVLTREKQFFSPWGDERSGKQHTVRLTDGGALSNSGLWSLYHLLKNRSESVRTRGVLLVIVDAGAMPKPERPNRVLGLVKAILDKTPKGEFLHRALLASLATTFGECFNAVELEIRPLRAQNVYTTWALDEKSIDKLRTAFKEEWAIEKTPMDTAFAQLKRCDPLRPSKWVGTSRVPLS